MAYFDGIGDAEAQTVSEAQAGLASSAAAAARYESDAHRFITEYGAAVIGGHAPVALPADGRPQG